jgi:hypothetical protein
MAASVETPSPNHTNNEGTRLNMVSATSFDSSSPSVSPSSDKRLWSNVRNRVDVLLEENSKNHKPVTNTIAIESERSKRFKNDSMLLLKGFDSVSHTLSLLSSNLDNALQVNFNLLIMIRFVSFSKIDDNDTKVCFCVIRELEN